MNNGITMYGAPEDVSSPWIKPSPSEPFKPLPDPAPAPPSVDVFELINRMQATMPAAKPEVARARAILAVVEACVSFDVSMRQLILQAAADLLLPPERRPKVCQAPTKEPTTPP